jgi:hypothetical protein
MSSSVSAAPGQAQRLIARVRVRQWNRCWLMTRRSRLSSGTGVVCLRSVLDGEQVAAVARHAPRAWRTSPPFDGLDAELPAGALMDHPLFPVVWPA